METAHSVLELVQFLVLPSCALLTAPHVQGTHSPSWNCMRTWDVNDSSKRVCLQTISWTEFACFRLCGDKLHAVSRKKSYVLESTWELLGGNGRWMWWMGHSSIVAWIIGSLRLPPTEWTYDSVSCLRIMTLAEWTLVPLVASVCLDHHRLLPPNWRTLGLLSGVSEGEVAAGVLPHSHGRCHYISPINMDWTWLNILCPTVSVQIVQQTIHIWSVNFAEKWFLGAADSWHQSITFLQGQPCILADLGAGWISVTRLIPPTRPLKTPPWSVWSIEAEVPKSVDYRKLLQEDAESLDDQIDEVRQSLPNMAGSSGSKT